MDDIKFDIDELLALIANKVAAKTREQFDLSDDAEHETRRTLLKVLREGIDRATTCGKLYKRDYTGAKNTHMLPPAINTLAIVTAVNIESEFNLSTEAYWHIYEKIRTDISAYLDGLRSLTNAIQSEDKCSQQ